MKTYKEILLLARHSLGKVDAVEIFNWEKLYFDLQSRRFHLSMLSTIGTLSGEQSPPKDILSQLKIDAINYNFISEIREERFHKILEKVRELEIEVFLLKGIVLSKIVYTHSYERFMGDIDILINEDDLEKVSQIMRDFGLVRKEDEKDAEIRHVCYFSKEIMIEIHWDISKKDAFYGKVILSEMLERAIPFDFRGVSVNRFSNEDFLMSLILHICRHNFRVRINSYYDIAMIVQKWDIDWKLLWKFAERYKLTKLVVLVLGFTKQLFDIQVENLDNQCFPNSKCKKMQKTLFNITQQMNHINPTYIPKWMRKREFGFFIRLGAYFEFLKGGSLGKTLKRMAYGVAILLPIGAQRWLFSHFRIQSEPVILSTERVVKWLVSS
ncbi:MAG: nucleotidyltransferase family protein [Bacillota bacterium]